MTLDPAGDDSGDMPDDRREVIGLQIVEVEAGSRLTSRFYPFDSRTDSAAACLSRLSVSMASRNCANGSSGFSGRTATEIENG